MNPLALLVNVNPAAIVEGLERKFEKDAVRIGMFVPAVVKRAGTLVADETTAHQLGDFLHEASGLIAEYVHKGNPKNWSLFGGDPFHQCREDVRTFAHKWALDPAFVEAMG